MNNDAASVLTLSIMRKVLMKHDFDEAIIRSENRRNVIFNRQNRANGGYSTCFMRKLYESVQCILG